MQISSEADRPWLFTRPGLLAMGLSDSVIRRALAVGSLSAVLPGVYASNDRHPEPDAAAVLRAVAFLMLPTLASGSVASHLSAAAVHGLAVPSHGPVVVHVTRPPPAKSRRGRAVWLHRGLLAAGDVVSVDDLAVTSPARTVVDCASSLGRQDAVALARTAVDRGLVSGEQLRAALGHRSRVPGIRAAGIRLQDIIRSP